jgi:hypothetical protein
MKAILKGGLYLYKYIKEEGRQVVRIDILALCIILKISLLEQRTCHTSS